MFLPTVSRIWASKVHASNPIDILNIKLKRFKKFFKGWGSNKFGQEKKRKQEIREELAFIEKLEEEGNIDHELFCRKTDLLVEMNEILVNEELFFAAAV